MSREAKLLKREKKLQKLEQKRGVKLSRVQSRADGEAFHIARHAYVMRKMQEKFAKEQALKRLPDPKGIAVIEPQTAAPPEPKVEVKLENNGLVSIDTEPVKP